MSSLDRVAARRIALIKPSALGDIVHTLPVLSALRARFPAAAITWVINSTLEPLLRGHPDLTDTLTFDRGAFRRAPWHAARYALAFGAELRRRRFDLVIDLQGLFRSALMCIATGARRRVGFFPSREGSGFAYTDRIKAPSLHHMHAVDRNWKVAEALGVGHLAKQFSVPLHPEELATATGELQGLPRPWLGVAVGAKWVTKRWPPGHFSALLRRAQAEVGGTCLFVGSRDDVAASQAVLRTLAGPGRDFCGRTSLPRLAALLSLCDAMVGNDTGPVHLAAALGRPCVAPYTCTRVALHGPYTSMAGGVETAVRCGGSYRKTCPDMVCMPDLAPDRLWPRLAEVLHAWQQARVPLPCRSA